MDSKIKQFKYTSSLSGFIQEHVAEKRALGVLFNTDAKILQNFDRYVLSWDGGTATTITQELADSYSKRRPNEGVAYQLLRIKTVNKLSSYMIRNGIDAYMIPSEKMPRKKESFTPYIFTDEQIERIFKATDTVSKSTSNRHQDIVAPEFTAVNNAAISPHILRHTKAMHLLQAGVNIVYIRDLLGHSDITNLIIITTPGTAHSFRMPAVC